MHTFKGKLPTGLLLCIMVLTAQMALADLTPPTLTATLEAGQSVSETKTATVTGIIPKGDIVFAFDLTGSMSTSINTAKAQAVNIMTSLNTLIGDSKFGVMSYMDYPHSYSSCGYSATYGSPSSGDYAYNLDLPLNSDFTTVSNSINSLVLGYGADGPQDYTRVFYESYADASIGYRTGAKKILLNFGDNIPHDCDINEGVPGYSTVSSRGGDPGRDEIMGNGDDLDLQTVLAGMASNDITLLEIHSSSSYGAHWDYWTGLTGGEKHLLSSPGDIPTAIYNLILAQATEIALLTLETEPGYEAWLTDVAPSQYVDITAPASVDFDIQVTVPLCTPAGYYEFYIYAIGDGAELGAQLVQITVEDNTPPMANCPANITVNNEQGACGAVVNFTATVTDDCPGATISCNPPSGTYFPVGTTVVTCTAYDASGNTDVCTFEVTVIDNELPVATCPGNIAVNNDPGVCGAVVNFTATATDNCPGVNISCVPPSGSYFPVGVTVVTCTAVDGSFNQDVCTFTVTVTDNEPPVANCPGNMAVNTDPGVCEAVVNFTATVTDNCPGASIACVPPSGSVFPLGMTLVTCTALDAYGHQDVCTFEVTVADNEAPVPVCPATVNLQCLANVPQPDIGLVTATDNCDQSPVITWVSDLSDGQTCPETITRTYRATDASSNWAECQQLIIIDDTIDPVCTVPANSSFFQCEPTEVCLPVSCSDNCDIDPTMTVTAGKGVINSGTWCYTPTVDETFTVTIQCTDDCGNTCEDSFEVGFVINKPPVVTCPQNAVIHWDDVYDGTATYTDPDAGQSVYFSLGSGSPVNMGINATTGVITWPTTKYDICDNNVWVIATDSCGASDTCEFNICVQNDPPEIVCPPDTVRIWWGYTAMGSVAATDPDDGPEPLNYTLASFSVPGLGVITIDPDNGDWTWETEETHDYVGVFELCIKVDDDAPVCPGCSPRNADTCCVIIKVRPRPQIVIEKSHKILQGHFTDISVTIENSDLDMGGFEFLIAYDASALSFIEATPGQLLEDCDWEYFTYRYGADGNCGDACPSGLLRIIAIAESSDGPNHPSCYGPPDYDPYELARIKFLVTNDRTFDCQYVPIKFFWGDCNDNSVSSVDGEILYVSDHVYDFEGTDITDSTFGFPTYYGVQAGCLEGDKTVPVSLLDLTNGGVDIVCADSIDARSDINANGIANEIADAVMLTNYFVHGLGAFLDHVEASIAASDINADGISLSVADLVYLVRVIVGDANPYAKPEPFAQAVSVGLQVNHSAVGLSTNSSVELGAGYFVFEHDGYEIGQPHLINGASNMSLKYSDEDGVLRVLVYTFEKGVSIPAGRENVFAFLIEGEGTVRLVESQISDYWGNLMDVKVESGPVMPSSFALHQSYPNPFNATTTIMYELPEPCHVRIDVFNVLGQKIITLFDGQESAGIHSVDWRGVDESGRTVSSGVYLYRLNAAGFTSDKKMVLMK
ncbi:MAG: HYR domain-containing protein [FCB group bacterium]|nr:HYR domain-containing protein [FCB group bacterium]